MPPKPHLESAAYKRVVALLLLAAYTCNSMDRTIISIVAQSLKADLKLSDTEVGLLGGTAFALLYAFGAIAIARLAEHASRVDILAAALAVWSSLTALCGAAGSFAELLLIRVSVGVAEAGCSPPAHSLISDYFPPGRRSSALAVYSCGISLGYMLAALLGGYVAQHAGWRMACAAAGIPGIVIALLIRLIVREPPRRYWAAIAPRFSLREELAELRAVAASLLFDRPIGHMVLGITIGGFAAYGFYGFVPAYFTRAFGLDYATTGVIAALTSGLAVGVGIVLGGFLADGLAKRGAGWYALVPALGGFVAVPLYALTLLANGWQLAACALGLAGFFQYASLGPTFGVVQNVVGARRRATATALLYIGLSVIALGLGQLFAGWVIDRFAQGLAPPGISFAAACPGGSAPAGASPDAALTCRTTLILATRRGMLVTTAFFAWAALHYLLAARGLAGSLRDAAQREG